MSNLQFWEKQRMIKELEFVESDFIYLNELIKNSHPLFLKEVEEMISKIPELDQIFNQENDSEVMEDVNGDESEPTNSIEPSEESNPMIKNLYRQIVKKTHPDKIHDLEKFYIEATKAYQIQDITTIIKICWDLNIPFDWDERISKEITSKINDFKVRKEFLENNYTFKWLKADDKQRPLILIEYLKNKISI